MHIPRYLLALAIALGAITSWTGNAAAQSKKKLAVLGLEVIDAGSGIDAKTTQLASQITEALRNRAREGSGAYSLAPHSTKDLLEMKLLSGCNDERESCMAAIGRDLNAEMLMYGKIQRLQDGFQVTLTLLDVKAETRKATTAKLSTGDAASQGEVAQWAVKQYNRVTGVPERGELLVKSNVSSGTVFVQGETRGALADGSARIRGLPAGTLDVAIEAPGHQRYEIEVDIKAGETTTLDATLETGALSSRDPEVDEEPARPGRMWRIATWGLLAAGLGAGGAMTWSALEVNKLEKDALEAFGLLPEASQSALLANNGNSCTRAPDLNAPMGLQGDALAAFNTNLKDLQDRCSEGDSAATRTTILIGVTVSLGAAAAFAFYKGYIAPDSAPTGERAGTARRSDETTVQVTPVVTPTYTGGALVIEF